MEDLSEDMAALYRLVFRDAVVGGGYAQAAESRLVGLGATPDQARAIRLEFEKDAGIIREAADPFAVLKDPARYCWYLGPGENDTFWPRVKDVLKDQLPSRAVEDVDESSTHVMQAMEPPGVNAISTRGLVLGYVQSGKTTNFISLIAKGADVGYRVFIVLSGITENLRDQTQQRVDDLLVGSYGSDWTQLTTRENDFTEGTVNAAAMLGQQGMRFVAVVKKNPARLRRLNKWLDAAGPAVLTKAPILIIDDEADQASVNVAQLNKRASTINGLLKKILQKPKAAYVGYTATPFANLLIDTKDTDDLYPRDFIVSLPEPEGYFGSRQLFGLEDSDAELQTDGLDLIRSISEAEAARAKPPSGKGAVESWAPAVEASLSQSLRWFVMSTAARLVREKGNPHATMLVHTSMLARAHEILAAEIESELDGYRSALEEVDAVALWRSQYLGEIAKVEASQFGHSAVSFADLWKFVPDVLNRIRVICDNYRSVERLAYSKDNPQIAIVVGGNTLSRGLTLEGLSSSYFVRSASAYDALLQMGRWFGYRHGYEDLCRIWMTEELRDWFRDLSTVEWEIRNNILRYRVESATPAEIAVRIRQHPQMAVTSKSKMRNAVAAQMSYSGDRTQTILFKHKDADWLSANALAVRSLIARVQTDEKVLKTFAAQGRRGFGEVNANRILEFIDEYRFHEGSQRANSHHLRKYIELENSAGSLLDWNIVFFENASGPSGVGVDVGFTDGSKLSPLRRAKVRSADALTANLKAITSKSDRGADLELSPEELKPRFESMPPSIEPGSDMAFRWLKAKTSPYVGMLGIYPIAGNSEAQAGSTTRVDLEAVENLFGITLFFPTARNSHSLIDYVVANIDPNSGIENDDEEISEVDRADAADERRAEETEDGYSGGSS